MNELRSKSPVNWLLIIFFISVGLNISVAGIENADTDTGIILNTSKPAADFPEIPIELNDKNLDSMLKLYTPLVVDAWEIGCRPCELIDPTINEMARDLRGRVTFGKLCIDKNPSTKNKYGISRTPTLLIFKNSTLVLKNVGNYPKEKLEEIILTVLRMR